jgi:hypothetical protein
VSAGDDERARSGEPAATTDAARERFYQGTILRLHPGSRSGTVRTGNGRDVAFLLRDVYILGTTRGFAALREGMRVGFDLGWTSRGVRVTTIRVYEDGER